MSSSDRTGESRRARPESRKARELERQRAAKRRSLAMLAVGVVAAAAIGLVVLFFATRPGTTLKPAASPAIDGIPCGLEQVTYHEHAHLTLQVRGVNIHIPDGIGHGNGGCLYWLHIHGYDPPGIIHLEAPHTFVPALGTFFDVWRQPLSRQRVWKYPVTQGQQMRVHVGQKLYLGDPRNIPLRSQTAITIQVGPPFPVPRKYVFQSGY